MEKYGENIEITNNPISKKHQQLNILLNFLCVDLLSMCIIVLEFLMWKISSIQKSREEYNEPLIFIAQFWWLISFPLYLLLLYLSPKLFWSKSYV